MQLPMDADTTINLNGLVSRNPSGDNAIVESNPSLRIHVPVNIISCKISCLSWNRLFLKHWTMQGQIMASDMLLSFYFHSPLPCM